MGGSARRLAARRAGGTYDHLMSRSKKQFRDYSPPQQLVLGLLIAVSLLLVGVAERDLQHRPADRVRGPKLLWRLVCLNALGSAAYLRWGRSAAAEPSVEDR